MREEVNERASRNQNAPAQALRRENGKGSSQQLKVDGGLQSLSVRDNRSVPREEAVGEASSEEVLDVGERWERGVQEM